MMLFNWIRINEHKYDFLVLIYITFKQSIMKNKNIENLWRSFISHNHRLRASLQKRN
jgi:hypothetical protein